MGSDAVTAVPSSPHVGFEVNGGVATLELRRPEKRNAVSRLMWESIIAHLGAAADDPGVRVLVLRGAGGVFCAGADLADVRAPDGTVSVPFGALVDRALTAIVDFPAPSVARIEGLCIGGGCSLALACDLRLAHPNATFSIPAVRHGIVYPQQSLDRLVDLLGSSRAARMMLTAEHLDAAQAARIGLIDECTQDLDARLDDFVSAVAAGDRDTVATTRRMLRRDALPPTPPARDGIISSERPR